MNGRHEKRSWRGGGQRKISFFQKSFEEAIAFERIKGWVGFLPYPSLAPGRTSFLAASDMMMILGILLLSFFLTAKICPLWLGQNLGFAVVCGWVSGWLLFQPCIGYSGCVSFSDSSSRQKERCNFFPLRSRSQENPGWWPSPNLFLLLHLLLHLLLKCKRQRERKRDSWW